MKTDSHKIVPPESAQLSSPSAEWADMSLEELKLQVQKLSEEVAHSNRRRMEEKLLHEKREESLYGLMSQKRKLAAHLMASHEEERSVVAREIHEELGQLLAALQVNVSLLTMESLDQAQLAARAQAMEHLLSTAMTTVQRISSELRPAMLDLLGLAEAIEWKMQLFRKTFGISCKTVLLLVGKNVDRDVSTAMYRILEEALLNVIRHADVTRVQVNLVERKGWLTLSVSDDGRGIIEKEKTELLSLGIAGIKERSDALGGKLRIFGIKQRGTALIARIPLTRKEKLSCPSEL
jgi:signal transduction histidine kinase